MAQIIVYGHREVLHGQMASISDTLHSCVVSALGLPSNKRFHRFIGLEKDCFVHPPDRSSHYLIIEIYMFTGRTKETKNELIRMIFERLEAEVGVRPVDVEIRIQETARENWGIRGKPGDELELNYQVEK